MRRDLLLGPWLAAVAACAIPVEHSFSERAPGEEEPAPEVLLSGEEELEPQVPTSEDAEPEGEPPGPDEALEGEEPAFLVESTESQEVTSDPEEEGQQPLAFEPEGRSLRIRRSIVVRAEPNNKASPVGTLAQDMRVRWIQVVRGPDCDAWVELEPRGWVCSRHLEPSAREPRVVELPRVLPDAITPGIYGKVVGKRVPVYRRVSDVLQGSPRRRLRGTVTVKRKAEVRIAGRRFWRTSNGELINARFIRIFQPSAFVGVDLSAEGAPRLPVAWVRRIRGLPEVPVRASPQEEAAQVDTLPPRTLLEVKERSADGAWVRVEQGWIAAANLHVALPSPPPPEVQTEERWIDVELDAQVLVAYEGSRPVYATLVSSGGADHPTPEGTFRIWIKYAEANMSGRVGRRPYRVAAVPWTMFFTGDFALHSAYWHDRFGEPVSHGCVNLAPQDARALYAWSGPQVPGGWSMVYQTPEHPGSLVRVRHASRAAEENHGPNLCGPPEGSPALEVAAR